MSSLKKLKAANSIDDVAELLGFQAKYLAFILYKVPDTTKYSEFEIPKRNGSKRKIKAPNPKLKLLQRRLANLLYLCLDEIGRERNARPLSHGFARGLSTITNASTHKRRRYVLNLDLKDFFPSINFGRVRGVLMKDKRFELHEKVATIIAQIACHDHSLPQGSPCSPVLSNIVGNLLDIRLVRLAKQNKCAYSRYADDITFSTSRKDFPSQLASPIVGTAGDWQLGPALLKEVKKAGFDINDTKTRMQIRGSRQMATGLLVNDKVNIRPEYYRTARAMCCSLFRKGTYFRTLPATFGGGKFGDPDINEEIKSLAPLEGMLAHIYHVRDTLDARDSAEKKKNASAIRSIYRKFLFFKNFIALERPLIMPEGPSDTIYLRSAIEKLPSFQPKLGKFEDGKLTTSVRFMHYSSSIHDLLQLGGGTGDFKFFILSYKKILAQFNHTPAHPVIMLIDNDDGAKDIFAVAKNNGAPGISHASTDLFYRLTDNLYLVKTPETGAKSITCIEDLFDPILLKTVLDGKTFDPYKKHEEPGKYGKVRFAEGVVRPQKDKIDFKGFIPLLNRIEAVLEHYAAYLATTTVASMSAAAAATP